jgi:hypothetical protein
MRLSLSPTPSNTPSNTPSVTPSSTSCPNFTPTATATLTPTPTTSTPVIYINLCVPQVVPADGRIPICIYSQTTSDCNGTRTNVSELTSLVGDLYVIFEGEPFTICGGILGTISAGTSCDCTAYCDAGPELSGLTVSAVTNNLFPFTLPSNYVLGSICYDSCNPCSTPTPTPTLTSTATPTLTVTSTSTPTPTPTLTPTSTIPCDAADYLLFNETASPLSWTALDCNGNGVGNTIPGGQQASTGCVQVGTLVEGSLTIVSTTPC